MARVSGFALVKGASIEVQVNIPQRDVVGMAVKANRYCPTVRTGVAKCTFVYEGMGKVSDVKIGRFVFLNN